MDQINIGEVKAQLREIAKAYQRPLHGKLALLEPYKEELLDLDTKGASTAEISTFLAQCKLTVSKDSVQRFLRIAKQKERSSRSKKANSPAPPDGAAVA